MSTGVEAVDATGTDVSTASASRRQLTADGRSLGHSVGAAAVGHPGMLGCTWPAKASLAVMDFRLELVQVPVSDVERARAFYTEKLGFSLDVDAEVGGEVRFVQLTPPGSPTSIAIGTGMTTMKPGSVEGLQLVVTDIEAARGELAGRGVEVSDVQHYDWGSFVFFSDPDGNGWAVQQPPARS